MGRPLSTLHGKIIGVMVLLITLNGVFHLAVTIVSTRTHLQAVDQSLNRHLAANIVGEDWLEAEQGTAQNALDHVFHRLMEVNPSIEIYLLDPRGRILDFSATPGKVKRRSVALQPIERFLANGKDLPVLGDDPRDLQGQKVFSAAPVERGGRLQGYVYAVLRGEQYDSVAAMMQNSLVLRLGLGFALGGVALTLVAGFLAFRLLTRRLCALSGHLAGVSELNPDSIADLRRWRQSWFPDEIDHLARVLKEMSERIQVQIGQLTSVDEARREFIADLSHDLQTPLASLRGHLETLQMKQETLSQSEKAQYLELSLGSCRRLARLIKELFELATLQTFDSLPHSERFSLGELLQDVSLKFRTVAQDKGIDFVTRLSAAPLSVDGNIGLIERLLENLLDNAIKFTPPGGRVRVSLISESGKACVTVSDTGPGIPLEEQAQIFERHYRVKGPSTETHGGAGLGLSIAQRIVELHGGTITVVSRPGQGAAFAFCLPA